LDYLDPLLAQAFGVEDASCFLEVAVRSEGLHSRLPGDQRPSAPEAPSDQGWADQGWADQGWARQHDYSLG